MECPKCKGLMREVQTNVRIKLPVKITGRLEDIEPKALECQECGYVELYIIPP